MTEEKFDVPRGEGEEAIETGEQPLDERELDDEDKKRLMQLQIMGPDFVDVRKPRKWTGTSRPAYIWPEVWNSISEVRKQKAIAWMEEKMKEL